MPDASTLLLFAGASLALLAVPGPAVVYVVTRSVEQGRAAGLVSVLGIETGTFAYAVAAAAGLTGLIAASETGFTVVRYAGAAYLVLLGVRKLRERGEAGGAAPARARSRLYLRGVLGTLFTLLAIASDSASVFVAGAVGAWLRGGRARAWLSNVSGTVYICLGVTAALSGHRPARG